MAVLRWHGIPVIAGVQGSIDAVVKQYVEGSLKPADPIDEEGACRPERSPAAGSRG